MALFDQQLNLYARKGSQVVGDNFIEPLPDFATFRRNIEFENRCVQNHELDLINPVVQKRYYTAKCCLKLPNERFTRPLAHLFATRNLLYSREGQNPGEFLL